MGYFLRSLFFVGALIAASSTAHADAFGRHIRQIWCMSADDVGSDVYSAIFQLNPDKTFALYTLSEPYDRERWLNARDIDVIGIYEVDASGNVLNLNMDVGGRWGQRLVYLNLLTSRKPVSRNGRDIANYTGTLWTDFDPRHESTKMARAFPSKSIALECTAVD